MGKWNITKEFHCSYGHSVYTQKLNEELSLDGNCACKFIHGHNAKILVTLEGESVDDRGMILDFKELNFFKKFVDDVIDHKFIMGLEDPLIQHEYPGYRDPFALIFQREKYGYFNPIYTQEKVFDPDHRINERIREKYTGVIFVSFVPTSENLAKWFYDIVQDKLNGIATVSHIEFYETPKSKSVYYG